MDDYDSPWKEALERFLGPFFEFFLPAAHPDIDWDSPAEHLDSELRKVVREAEQPNRRADHLVRIKLRGGEDRLVLIHVEVQNQVDESLAERLFTSGYRIYDRFRLPVVSLAVLGSRRQGWDPGRFGWSLRNMGLEGRFHTVQLLDFEAEREELRLNSNPFALVVLAHLQTRDTRSQASQRRHAKIQLTRLLFERRYSREDVLELFRLIDWMMALPETEDRLFQTQLQQLEEEMAMPYITSVERLARQDGIQQGLEQGLERGLGPKPRLAPPARR